MEKTYFNKNYVKICFFSFLFFIFYFFLIPRNEGCLGVLKLWYLSLSPKFLEEP
jgi:hypothetical protein